MEHNPKTAKIDTKGRGKKVNLTFNKYMEKINPIMSSLNE